MLKGKRVGRIVFGVCSLVLLSVMAAAAVERVVVTDPDKAMQMLVEGNKRFMTGKTEKQDISDAKREDLFKNGQTPFVSVVSCSDSRVPPELVFDQGLGDVFVVRAAGNVLDPLGMGSIEFSIAVLKSPLIVVMGHEDCGAIHATVGGVEGSYNIATLAGLIQPAVTSVRKLMPDASSRDIYEPVTDENVKQVVAQLKENEMLKKFIAEKKLKVVGGKYRQATGQVEFFE